MTTHGQESNMLLHSLHAFIMLSNEGLKAVFYTGVLLLLSFLTVVPSLIGLVALTLIVPTLIGVDLTSSILVVLSLPPPLGLIGILVARLPLVVVLCLTRLILLLPPKPRHVLILVLTTVIRETWSDWNVL